MGGLFLVASAANAVAGSEPLFERTDLEVGLDFVHADDGSMPGHLPDEQTRYGAGAAVGDIDGDGDLDLYLVNGHGSSNRLYRNDGGIFVDITAEAGVGDTGYGRVAYLVDLDGDDLVDILVVNDSNGTPEYRGPVVYRNAGDGTFTDVTEGSGLDFAASVVGGATLGDIDLDGDLDLFITAWLSETCALYRNDGEFRFTEVTDHAGLGELQFEFTPQWTPVLADLDGDLRPDIFCAVDFAPDYLFRNLGDGRFSRVEQASSDGYSVNNDMGVAVGDFDEDGDLDLYTTNITQNESQTDCCNWLYVNDGTGQFENQAEARGVANTRWGWGTAFLDADLDGDLDILAVNGWQQPEWITSARYFANDGTGHYTETGVAAGLDHVGNSRGLTVFDADRDGDLDVVITDLHDRVVYLENVTLRGDRHYLTVQLDPTVSAPHGVGAVVEVHAGDRRWFRPIVCGGSFYSGVPLEANVGLGARTHVDSVVVRWPSGARDVVVAPGVDRVLVVTEGPVPAPPPATPLGAVPNPAGGAITLRYAIDGAGEMTIYDVTGRVVWRRALSPGSTQVTWDGRSSAGEMLANGVYVVELRSGGRTEGRRRVTLVR
jgi:hypothetical protein